MEDYLKGFNDGFNKAMELKSKKESAATVTIDGKAMAKEIYKDIKLLQDRDEQARGTFGA